MAIEGIAVLELDEHGVSDGGIEKAERKLQRDASVAYNVSLVAGFSALDVASLTIASIAIESKIEDDVAKMCYHQPVGADDNS